MIKREDLNSAREDVKRGKIDAPVYLYDAEAFASNVIALRTALQEIYPNVMIGYSYKTNYLEPFLNTAIYLGVKSEVVSRMEYEMAKAHGVEDCNIIYNGPMPDFDNKLSVALSGGLVHIDNVIELKDFVEYAEHNKIDINLGVRITFDVGNGIESRFGIHEDSADFEYVKGLLGHPYLHIVSLHCHFSCSRQLKYFKKKINKMVFYANLFGVKSIDIGGNMYGPMALYQKAKYDEPIPTFEDYAGVICSAMSAVFPDEDVTLICENGTALVANAMHCLATVVGVKEVNGRSYVLANVRREDLSVTSGKLPICEYIGANEIQVRNPIVVGCSCRENEFLGELPVGYVAIGGKIVIKNIGAYSCNCTNDFITPGCRGAMNRFNVDLT